MDLGLACHVCGTLNQISAQSCSRCGTILAPSVAAVGVPAAAAPGPAPIGASPAPPVTTSGGTQPGDAPAAPMEVAQVAPSISGGQDGVGSTDTGMPSLASQARARGEPAPSMPPEMTAAMPQPEQRFDPATGQPLAVAPVAPGAAKTLFFGALQQQPVVPRLVVIKGEGGDGATYHLQGTTTVIGRSSGDISFAEDPFLSPSHAKFTSQDGRLFVQDVGSTNGVFLRIKKPTSIKDGTHLLVGEQLLRLINRAFSDGSPNQDGTYYYGSPRPAGRFQVVQCLAGGGEGRLACAENGSLSMGREGNTLNFPDDRFISGRHARLDAPSDSEDILLTDAGSRNGTFIRIDGAQELFHGDYLFVGQQLLRVEIA